MEHPVDFSEMYRQAFRGEWMDDYRTFLIEKPDLNIPKYISG
jgi:hypothetical protein